MVLQPSQLPLLVTDYIYKKICKLHYSRDVYHHQLLLSIITSYNYHDMIFIMIFILNFVLILVNKIQQKLQVKIASYHLIFTFTLQSLHYIMCVLLKITPEPLTLKLKYLHALL